MSGPGGHATTDTLLGGRVTVHQPIRGYRAAVDPVLLAAAVEAGPGARVLDAGCGTGASSFCLLARCSDLTVTGLDNHVPYVDLARTGLAANAFAARGSIVCGDLAAPPPGLGAPFDVVMTNPPFYQRGTVPPHPDGETPYAVTDLSLEQWIAASLALLRKDGLFAIIHRAERLADIIAVLKGCGAVTVLPLWPKAGRDAKRVVVTARKDRRTPARVLPGLILHTHDGGFTPEAEAVLREGASLAPAA
jgi:tRNA1(Val) A37 N6-methylase TrmN6